MKKILPIWTLVFLFSCTKEKTSVNIPGTWAIVESNIGTGTGYTVQTYLPSSEFTVEFRPDNGLRLVGTNPGTANSPLWQFDRYAMLADDKIRFYQSAGNEEMEAFITLNGELYLNYLWARCGYEEKFLKVK